MKKKGIQINHVLLAMPAEKKKEILQHLKNIPKDKQRSILATPILKNESDNDYIDRVARLASRGETYNEYLKNITRGPRKKTRGHFFVIVTFSTCFISICFAFFFILKESTNRLEDFSKSEKELQSSLASAEKYETKAGDYPLSELGADYETGLDSSYNDSFYNSPDFTDSFTSRDSSYDSNVTPFDYYATTENIENTDCSAERLHRDQAIWCAEKWRSEQKSTSLATVAERTVLWCDENMPEKYQNYKRNISAENRRYLSLVSKEAENSSLSGGSFSGRTSLAQRNAESRYKASHEEELNTIKNRYVQEAQDNGCDPYAYGDL